MVGVNLLGILLGSALVMGILKHYGRSPWWGLCYPSFWGLLLCLLRCLPEPLSIAFLALAIWAYLKEKWIWWAVGLSLAALTQETTLMVSMAFLSHFLLKREYGRTLYVLPPFLAYGAWQGYIFYRFKTFSFLGGTQNFSLPFQGLLQKLVSLTGQHFFFENIPELIYLTAVFGLILIAFYQVLKKMDPLTLSFAGYALMTAFLNQLIWVEPWSYARATLGLLFFNLLIFTKGGSPLNLVPALMGPLVLLTSLVSMRLL